jgi:hypothetical protein
MTPPRDGHIQSSDGIELPAPTPWPMVLALGITLGFAGLVTHAAVSVVGIALALIAAVGWWREVLPEQRMERLAVAPVELRAQAIVPARPAVQRDSIGEGHHRARVPVEIQPYSAGIRGGLVGGLAMAVPALAYGLIAQRSLWYPINLLAAMALPAMAQASLAELRSFSLTALVLGVVVHGVVSALVGLLYAVILPMLPRRHMLWGGLIAPLLWTGLLWAVLGVVNPTLATRVDWPWFVISQIAFGLAAGVVVARAQPLVTMQTWPLAARAGVEASKPRAEQEGDR